MSFQTFEQSHQSPAALAATWKLAVGKAITLQPRQPGLLRIAHGSVWVTGDGPHPGPLNDQGDRFLGAGERLPLACGERLVIEGLAPGQPACFSWDPLPQATIGWRLLRAVGFWLAAFSVSTRVPTARTAP